MVRCCFPQLTLDKIVGATQMLRGYTGAPDLTTQAASQKTLKQWVQAILLAATIAGHRDEYIATYQGRQDTRAVHVSIERGAPVEFETLKQRDAQQQLLNFLRLAGKNFLGEIVENIALRLAQNLYH